MEPRREAVPPLSTVARLWLNSFFFFANCCFPTKAAPVSPRIVHVVAGGHMLLAARDALKPLSGRVQTRDPTHAGRLLRRCTWVLTVNFKAVESVESPVESIDSIRGEYYP